ncbi:MAG: M56 family metallopeptidase [Pseudomonadales bacterium]|nr:M56 family metallopeptidase [Pseudomonadales bacterium]
MNLMQTLLLPNPFEALAYSAVLQVWLDIFFKSTLLVGFTCLLSRTLAKRAGSSHRHLLWISCILCLALLPLLPMLTVIVGGAAGLGGFGGLGGLGIATPLFSLNVFAEQGQMSAISETAAGYLWLYLLPMLYLLTRLLLALLTVLRINKRAQLVVDRDIQATVHRLCVQLQITRQVTVRKSLTSYSPFSFGMLNPVVILPPNYSRWSKSVLEDVLVHELTHIRRLDWLSMLLCHLVLCIYWFNPLVWLAVSKVDEEAENSCDAAVIRCGKSNTEYAENLLLVARECRAQKRLLAQMIVDRNLLSKRIETILENAMMMKTISRKMLALSAVMVAILLAGLGHMQVLAVQAQEVDREMYPLATVMPYYPRKAAEEGIEGWVQVKFNVNPDGSVSPDSISVVDSEPAIIFDNSAREATTRFAFSPRVRNGEAVVVENVQYVFRYQLRDYEDNQAWLDSFGDRKPPQSRGDSQIERQIERQSVR